MRNRYNKNSDVIKLPSINAIAKINILFIQISLIVHNFVPKCIQIFFYFFSTKLNQKHGVFFRGIVHLTVQKIVCACPFAQSNRPMHVYVL